VRANELQARNAEFGFDETDALLAVARQPGLREEHEAMLPPTPPRRRGDIEADRAVAAAKLVDAETIEDALAWLKPKERMVVLHDRALLALITRLKPAGAQAQEAAE
jgi:membrane glycosyltransferase